MTPAANRRAGVCAAAVAALLVGVVSCGDGDGDREPGPTQTPSVTRTAETTKPTDSPPSEATSVSPTPTATAPEDPAEAEADVREAWQTFFDPQTSVKEKAEVLEDGAQYELMVRGFAQDEHAGKLRATVGSVEFTSPIDAEVTYTLSLDSRSVRPSGPGKSVLQGDTWKLSFQTLCALAKHGTDVPRAAGCE
ncbi:hypothetical protein [Streptomyces sp. 7N604]|uniref:hypothetical protein n=1 Tax=Streptomyces sp. 7N604 TaxID=3457415 RepID=UPI003FD2E278